jgi:hypothetical protein
MRSAPLSALAAQACLLAGLLLSTPALADGPPPDPKRAEAADRFDRALHLVDSGDLSGGLAEFQRAYALVPLPIVLYNIGLVNASLGKPVPATRALETVLKTPEALKPEFVERARTVLKEQGERIGQVVVTTNVKEGVVEIDNVETAHLPLSGPLDVGIGSHVVGVVSPGFAPVRKAVLVASHDKVEAQFELVAIEGRLAHIRVKSKLPAADVLVDGDRIGQTPLESTITVAPGPHHITVTRAGYTPAEHDLTLQDGAQGDLSLNPTVDKSALSHEGGALAITASEPLAVVAIDGDDLGALDGPLQLPAGPHRLRLERGGFEPAERDVTVPVGRTATVNVVFEPNPDTRAKYVSGAQSRKLWSWVTVGAGVAIAAGGTVLAVVENGQIPGYQSTLDAVNADFKRFSLRRCDFSGQLTSAQMADCENRLNSATDNLNNAQTLRTVGFITAGVGAATAITGLVLLLTGDDPHKYDQKPSGGLAQLRSWTLAPQVGRSWAALSLTGQF